MFVLHLAKVSLVKHIRYKNVQMERGEPFDKEVVCLHAVIFVWQRFDWVLCIVSKCDWMNNF